MAGYMPFIFFIVVSCSPPSKCRGRVAIPRWEAHAKKPRYSRGDMESILGLLAGLLYRLCNGDVITSAVCVFLHFTFSVILNVRGGRERLGNQSISECQQAV